MSRKRRSYSGFTSGHELLRIRNRDQTLLETGEKVDECVGSWMEEKMVESRLKEHQLLIKEPKIARKDQLATGEWLPESKMVKLSRPGKFWQHMGVETDIGKCLYPEEAVYLIDIGELEVVYDGLPLSLQRAQTVLLKDAHHMDQYLVYSHITRTGCKVVRHQPHLIFTKYEKEIRIDQHQASRRGAKLKLETNKDSPDDSEPQNTPGIEQIDSALEELYASLGDAAVNPLTVEKKDASPSVGSPAGTERKTEKKPSQFTPKAPSQHEIRRRELIELFPSMIGTDNTYVDVESADLFPENVVPSKQSYKISTEALEYYSIYDTRHSYHYDNQRGHNRTVKMDSWNEVRDERWNSNSDSNWKSRNDWDRGNRWQQQDRYQRDSYGRWGEDRNGRWGGGEDSDWRHYGDSNSDWRHRNDPNSDWRQRTDPNSDWRERTDPNSDWREQTDPNSDWRHRTDPNSDWRHHSDPHSDWRQHNDPESDWRHQSDPNSDWRHRIETESDAKSGEGGNSDPPPPQDKEQVDYSVWPEWKRKRRRKYKQQGREKYPSCIVKLRTRVTSWKEYKALVAEMNAKKQLTESGTGVLWGGRTVPLLTPPDTSSSTSTSSISSKTSPSSILSSVSLGATIPDLSTFKNAIPQEDQLNVLFDVYLPSVTYKKTNPSSPSKRVVVLRDGSVPSPGQIFELTSRFVDGVAVVYAVVLGGEVRLYTFSPLSLGSPQAVS